MIKLRNKIIIFLVLSILVVSGVNAIDYDEDLFNVWKRRVDLQKVFPDFYKDLDKIVNWAKGYGWKEDMSLIRYSPYKEIVDSVNYDFEYFKGFIESLENGFYNLSARVNKLELKIKRLENRVNILQDISVEDGKWIKCCGARTIFGCGEYISEQNCSKYEFEIFVRNYEVGNY